MPTKRKVSPAVKAAAERAIKRSNGEDPYDNQAAPATLDPMLSAIEGMGMFSTDDAPSKPKAKRGRPTDFTPELAEAFCDHIASGESLRSFCEIEGNPHKKTILRWLRLNPDFSAQYARAREEAVESHVAEMVSISDDTDLKPDDKRVRIDTRKWIAERMKPKKYGQLSKHELSGPDGGPIQVVDMSMREAARKLAFMMREAIEASQRAQQSAPQITAIETAAPPSEPAQP